MKTFLTLTLVAVIAAGAGWLAARHDLNSTTASSPATGTGRKILFYQSPMHPWIKSPEPGNCTICGMKMVAVYEGDKPLDAGTNLVTLSTNSMQVLQVRTSEVGRRPLSRTLRVGGRIDDDDTRHRIVSAYVEGRIDRLAVNHVGAEVSAGEPLATFYSPVLMTAAEEYLNLVRQGKLLPESAAQVRAENTSMVEAAAVRLHHLGFTPEQIEQLATKGSPGAATEIRAPMTGTVVQRFVYEGAYVKEGDKLFEIGDFGTMWFLFDAYEADLAWLRAGQIVEVTTPSAPGRVFRAPIKFIDPNLNELTRSAKVRVELANPLVEENGQKRRVLLHRLFGEGRVTTESEPVLAIDRAAVLTGLTDPGTYVDLGGGNYQYRRLKLGRAGDTFWEVLEGVAAGEKVVTNGGLLIDSQAQLQHPTDPGTAVHQLGETEAHGAAEGHATHGSPVAAKDEAQAKLSEAQVATARAFLGTADKISAALAADDLAGFNQAAARLHAELVSLEKALSDAAGWSASVQALAKVGHLAQAKDLVAARQAFFPFSQATTELAARLRKAEPAFAGVKIFQCPMANKAIAGAVKTGLWTQMGGPLRNPFFGSEMLDCGNEVRP